MPQNFYALLVGIDDYAHVDKLEGCVKDVNMMRNYLQRSSDNGGVQLHLKILRDSEATKPNIVHTFLNHLGKAQEGDVALFYFAGHGSQEVAGEVFDQTEADKLLEIIICQDSTLNQSGMDISDKELRYMIHKVAEKKPHFVTIFDCCFSGGNTRNISSEGTKVPIRRLDTPKPQRGWDDFIFSREIRESDFRRNAINELLPNGNHIHLAACGRDEEANEDPIKKCGLFTALLVEKLKQTKGNISYHDLFVQLRTNMDHILDKFRHRNIEVAPQHPEIYTKGDFAQVRFQKVFDGALIDFKRDVQINFNFQERDWQMNAGTIHGVKKGNEVKIEGNETLQATVKLTSPTISFLHFVGENPSKDLVLKGQVKSFRKELVKVFFNTLSRNNELDKIKEIPVLEVVENRELADYILEEVGNKYHLLSSTNQRLLFPPFPKDEAFFNKIHQLFSHIAHWEYLRKLESMSSNSRMRNSVEMQIAQTDIRGFVRRFRLSRGNIQWHFKEENGKLCIYFKVKLINKTDKPLFCSLVYLSQTFEVNTDLLEKSVIKIDPGESNAVLAAGGQRMELRAHEFFVRNRWPMITEYFKLIVSTEMFDLDMFRLDSLHSLLANDSSNSETSRNIRDQKWEVQTLVVEQVLPTI